MNNKSTDRYLFSVCIITLARPALLDKCLNAIAISLDTLPKGIYEIVVSDDCRDKSAYPIVQKYQNTRWIQGPSMGVAANRNNVVKSSRGEWIIFIDDDEYVDANLMSIYYNAFSSNIWDVLEGRVQPVNFPDSILWYAPSISEGGAYCTANLAIKRDLIKKIGYFNEEFNVSHEDVEMGKRIRESNARSLYLNDAIAFHPARKYTIKQVIERLINLQCQSFYYQNLHLEQSSASLFPILIIFCIKYWWRVTRFELHARLPHQWQRQFQVSVLLLFTSTIAFFILARKVSQSQMLL